MRVTACTGWVLHRRPWRESSLLVELFTTEHGRIGAVARGARSARSAWRGLAEPFQPLELGWVRRGELATLNALEPVGQRLTLAGRSLWCGLYVNELLMRLLPRDDPAPLLYDHYQVTLTALTSSQDQAAVMRRFEWHLLTELGVMPQLDREAESAQPLVPDQLYRLDPEAGPRSCDKPAAGTFPGRIFLMADQAKATDPVERRQLRDLMRLLIEHQLDGTTLQTPKLFRSWK